MMSDSCGIQENNGGSLEAALPKGIFTQEQIDETNDVCERDLRSTLLHNIRLRNNMERDRDAFERTSVFYEERIKAIRRILREEKLIANTKVFIIEKILNWNPGPKSNGVYPGMVDPPSVEQVIEKYWEERKNQS